MNNLSDDQNDNLILDIYQENEEILGIHELNIQEINGEENIEENTEENIKENMKEIIPSLKAINHNKEETTTTNTRRGRTKMNNNNNKIHSKNSTDNKVRKIRIHAIKFGINLINDAIKTYLKKRHLILRGICKTITADISIIFNNHFFNSTLTHIYSNPVNRKYKNCNKDENKKVIQTLLDNNHPVINEILNMKFIDFYNNIFIGASKEDLEKKYGLISAKNFQDFLDELENDSDEYKEDLKIVAYDIKKYFIKDNARNNYKNKDKLVGTNFSDCIKK